MSNEEQDLDVFRDRVKSLLADQDLTQKAFEQQHDLSRGILTRLFGGRKKMDLETLEEVAAGLGVPAITLVEGTGFAGIVDEVDEPEADAADDTEADDADEPEADEVDEPEADDAQADDDPTPEPREAAAEPTGTTAPQPEPTTTEEGRRGASPDEEPTEEIHRKLPLEDVPFVGLVVRGLANLLGRR